MGRIVSKKRSKKILLIAIVLFVMVSILIGYAYLNKKLSIEGDTTVAKNTWGVEFQNIKVLENNAKVETAPYIYDNKSKVNFVINLEKPGDSYTFTVDVVNIGNIDAMLNTISLTDDLATKTNYLDYSLAYTSGATIQSKDSLKAGKSVQIKFSVTFKKDITSSDLENEDTSLNLTLQQNYVQADGTEESIKHFKLPEGKTKDTLVVGDEICTGTECFNFIRYDGDNIVMLAKYNLNVGNNPKGEETFRQDSDVKGWLSSGTKYGNVAFSYTNYWNDKVGTTSEYIYQGEYSSPNYPYVYDAQYKVAPNFTENGYSTTGYSVAYYVEKYKDILEGMGIEVEEARLLKFTETVDSSIGCNASNNNCPTTGDSSFITNTSFWLGSARSTTYVWVVDSYGYFGDYGFGNVSYFGVRPVIEVPKTSV